MLDGTSYIRSERDLHHCIDVLIANKSRSKLDRRRSAIAFAEWLRWQEAPSAGHSRVLAMISAMTTQFDKREMLDEADLARISQLYRPFVFLNRFLNHEDYLPFPDFDLEFERVDLNVIADSVLVVCYAPGTKPMSLTRTWESFADVVFSQTQKHTLSPQRCEALWRQHRRASAFLYVNIMDFNCRWFLDPTSRAFADDLDNIIDDTVGLKTYFENVVWIQERLSARLHRNALKAASFFALPDSLKAVEPLPPEISPEIATLLSKFRP